MTVCCRSFEEDRHSRKTWHIPVCVFTVITEIICIFFLFQPNVLHLVSKTSLSIRFSFHTNMLHEDITSRLHSSWKNMSSFIKHPQHLFGPLSTGPLSTGPLSTGPLFTGPLFTGPLSTGPLSTGPLSTGPLFTGPHRPQSGRRYVFRLFIVRPHLVNTISQE